MPPRRRTVLALLLVAACAQRTAIGQSSLWFNSVHLAAALEPQVSGLERGGWPAPLSDKGAALLDELARRGLSPAELFEQPVLMASVVLAGINQRVPVVPTEEYFYFEILFGDEWIAGNLRTTDAASGVLHCGYYMRSNPRASRYAAITAADGLCVSEFPAYLGREVCVIDEKTGTRTVFEIRDPERLPFQDAVPRRAAESLVSPIIDESGSAFVLLFNNTTCEFYYALAAPAPNDSLMPLEQPGAWLGAVSGFVYVEDGLGRLLLAGVSAERISMNTFYDGPFDQVPPRLPIRERIRWAYPGIEDRRRDSLDPHGGWLGLAGARVAIAPYIEYEAGDVTRCVLQAVRSEAARDPSVAMAASASAADATIRRFADVVREHAHEWPQSHNLRASASRVPN